jgi:hypothetical protein
MIIHHVSFNLKKGADLRALRRGLKTLLAIPGVADGWYGGVAKTTKRPAVDQAWDQVLVLHFADIAAHDAYQAHPVHQRFVDGCRGLWSKVRVIDSDVG